ncbi:MAG: hypothetical protein PUP92_32945 [Rhizonema sp. PD38]|nr:hypothetical protein [Rhizonema sp. PD38]
MDEVLQDHPAVRQVVTFAAPHTLLGEEVAAAIVLKENASATELEIKEFVSQKLADFKVPRVVLFVDEIPKGPTGKLQRIGLAEKLGLRASDPTAKRPEFVPPRTAREEQLVNIWTFVLGVSPIGINDNFFNWEEILSWRLKLSIAYSNPCTLNYHSRSSLSNQLLPTWR